MSERHRPPGPVAVAHVPSPGPWPAPRTRGPLSKPDRWLIGLLSVTALFYLAGKALGLGRR